MAERSFDPASLADMRSKLRVVMALVSQSPRFANRSIGADRAAYAWLGECLGIDGEVDVDALDLPTLHHAFTLLRPDRVKARASSIDAAEFDEWLWSCGLGRADFAAAIGRDPRAVEGWSGQIPRWAEVVISVLEALPELWDAQVGRDYSGSSADFKRRLDGTGCGIAQFSRLTGTRDDTVRRWANSQIPPGWVEIVLRGLGAGVIAP